MRKRYAIGSVVIDKLRSEVENYVSRRLSTVADFNYLSDILNSSGFGYVSATTLKRVWGYINDTGGDYSPGNYTLRALCNLIGFRDIVEFEKSSDTIQSREYSGNFIESQSLPEGVEVEVNWSPNRRCVLRHLKATLFEVVVSEFSRLRKDDIVECGCFTQNAPLYFTRVFRKGMSPRTYIAGTSSGITYIVKS